MSKKKATAAPPPARQAHKPAPPAATGTRYQQWVAAGRPYHKGLSIFNEVPGFAVLKKTLERGPSPYNNAKLEAQLRVHFDRPATAGRQPDSGPAATDHRQAPKAQSRRMNGYTHRQEQRVSDPPAPPAESPATDEGGGEAKDDEDDPRDLPHAYTPRAWKARPFSELPEPLKKLRIAIIRDYRLRAQKHAELRAHPRRKEQRTLLCRAIVETTDRINAHWAIEEAWTRTGALPHLPEDEAERIARADIWQLQREVANQLSPQIWRLTEKLRNDTAGKVKLTEEERIAAEMRKGALEHTRALIKQRLLAYQHQVKA